MIGIDPEVFIEGKLKLILGTLWLLIHKYEIAEISEDALTAKDGLLLWCINRTAGYRNVKVENYHRSWKDGLAFCAIIHKHRPDLIRFDELRPDNKYENLKLAFDIFENKLNITRLIDPEDMIGDRDDYKPDERSVMTYLSQIFQLFASTQKSDLAKRRIERVVTLTELNDSLKASYIDNATKLINWIMNSTAEMQTRNFGNTSEQVEEKLTAFLKYKHTVKANQTKMKAHIEGQLNNIATKLWSDSRPPFEPTDGLRLYQINEYWEKLNKAEREKEMALRGELERLNKLEYLCKKFAGKSGLMEIWLKEKKEYLSSTDYGDSIQAVQAKIRAQGAFDNQIRIHETRITELRDMIQEIAALLKTQPPEKQKLQNVEDSWNELLKMSELRNKALVERLKERHVFEDLCQRYSKLSEELFVWLEKIAEDMIDPVVVNSTHSVQVLLEGLGKTRAEQKERQPIFDEIEELAEKIAFGGLTDLHQICEYSLDVFFFYFYFSLTKFFLANYIKMEKC